MIEVVIKPPTAKKLEISKHLGQIGERVGQKTKEWTVKGKEWLARLREKVTHKPKEVLLDIAKSPQIKNILVTDTYEKQLTHVEESPESEASLEARDLFKPGYNKEFADRLKESNGKAFVCVHPFFEEDGWYRGHIEDVMSGREPDPGRKKFWTQLAEILPKLAKAKIPIVFLQEMPYIGENWADDTDKIRTEYSKAK